MQYIACLIKFSDNMDHFCKLIVISDLVYLIFVTVNKILHVLESEIL